jgi:hypothetical protein
VSSSLFAKRLLLFNAGLAGWSPFRLSLLRSPAGAHRRSQGVFSLLAGRPRKLDSLDQFLAGAHRGTPSVDTLNEWKI